MELHEEVLDAASARLLESIGSLSALSQFYLAGGTGLALQLGHRRSLDLDLFSERKWSPELLLPVLAGIGPVAVDRQDEDTLVGGLAGVRISFFFYPYRLLRPPLATPYGVSLASLLDIGCMKMVAVSQRGSRKDFVDLYALGRAGLAPQELLRALGEEAPATLYNPIHIARSLAYFSDAEEEPPLDMLEEHDWNAVKRYCLNAGREILWELGVSI
jgi:hypothetical protein